MFNALAGARITSIIRGMWRWLLDFSVEELAVLAVAIGFAIVFLLGIGTILFWLPL